MRAVPISALLIAFASLALPPHVRAATTQPNATVSASESETAQTSTTGVAKPTPEASTPTVTDPAPKAKGHDTEDGDFKPSEEISEDMAVAYPVDI
jgi:hypothetical protein